MTSTPESKADAMRAAGEEHPTVFVDGEPHRVQGPIMTGAEILALAGRPAEAHLYAEGHHGQRIQSDQMVPVQEGSRFHTHEEKN